MKKDTVTQVVFLDEAMKVRGNMHESRKFDFHITFVSPNCQLLENKPSAIFWTSLGKSLDKHARDSAKSAYVFEPAARVSVNPGPHLFWWDLVQVPHSSNKP